MSEHVRGILRELGFDPDECMSCPDFHLIEPLLAHVNKENIVSSEELEALELAKAAGLKEEDVLRKLAEHGIDEDVLDIEESDIEYLEKKLSSNDLNALDNEIYILRKQQHRAVKCLEELKEMLDHADLNSHLKTCEELWQQISLTLQNMFHEIRDLDTRHKDTENAQNFKTFSVSYERELNRVIEHVTQFIDKIAVKVNGNSQNCEENASSQCSEKSERLKNIIDLESSLKGFNFEKLCQELKNVHGADMKDEPDTHVETRHDTVTDEEIENELATPVTELGDLSPENVAMKGEKCIGDVLNLSEKLAQLHIKENLILPTLEQTSMQGELGLKTCMRLLQALKTQRDLLDLVSAVLCVYHEEYSTPQELINDCYQNVQQELENMSSRIKYLNEAKEKFENYVHDKLSQQNTLPQELQKLVAKHFPTSEQKSLENMIVDQENKLQLLMEQQKISVMNSKEELSEMNKIVDKIRVEVNSTTESLSELEFGFKAALNNLQAKKENAEHLKTLMSENSANSTRRLWWIYFLTNIDKLKEIKQQMEIVPETLPGTPSFRHDSPCFTSTPKEDEWN